MKMFQDLELRGDKESLACLMEIITARLRDGWARAQDVELRFQDIRADAYCFSCSRTQDREPATLVFVHHKPGPLSLHEPDLLRVANILPHDTGKLSIDQYNHILQDFYGKFVRSAAEELAVKYDLSPAEEDLKDLISEESADKLIKFSQLANKSTGSSHPSDTERWFDFLVTMHKEKCKLDYDILFRWLVEEEDWPQEVADDLVSEYDSALRLLEFYDRKRS